MAVAATAEEAYKKAFSTDPTSAFGGIIALNTPLDEAGAREISKQFVEVLMAPAYSPEPAHKRPATPQQAQQPKPRPSPGARAGAVAPTSTRPPPTAKPQAVLPWNEDEVQ